MPRQKPVRNPVGATIRVGTAVGLLRALRSQGLDPEEVLADGGFDPGIFDDADNLISITARSRLVAYCAGRAQSEHFGLQMAQGIGLDSLGLVGLLVRYSADVQTALHNLVRYFHLHARGGALNLEVQRRVAVLSYQIHDGATEVGSLVCDAAVGILFNLMGELCGPDWKPAEVSFTHRQPRDAQPYRRFFRAPLQFDAEQNALVFPASWLKRPIPYTDSELRRLLQKQIDALASRFSDDFPEQVRTVLRGAMLSGDARADQVAALFSMHPRTLNRHLGAYGVNYRGILDETRFEIARQMLTESDLDIAKIAMTLHYADARSFIRAFRRWSGVTPARWRAANR